MKICYCSRYCWPLWNLYICQNDDRSFPTVELRLSSITHAVLAVVLRAINRRPSSSRKLILIYDQNQNFVTNISIVTTHSHMQSDAKSVPANTFVSRVTVNIATRWYTMTNVNSAILKKKKISNQISNLSVKLNPFEIFLLNMKQNVSANSVDKSLKIKNCLPSFLCIMDTLIKKKKTAYWIFRQMKSHLTQSIDCVASLLCCIE